jgi:hypothetical protein
MNEILIWAVSTFFGIVVTILLTDTVQNFLAKIFGGLGLIGSNRKLNGYWTAKITYPVEAQNDDENYIFELKQIGKLVIGKNLSTDSKKTRTVKIRGKISDERYLTGEWKSKLDDLREYHGTFQLGMLPHGNKLNGKWIGFSKDFNVYCGEWEMERISEKSSNIELDRIKEKNANQNWQV